MNSGQHKKKFMDEIKLFIEYGVAKEEQQTAFDVLKTYEGNSVALTVLKDFYSRLPELRDEAVCKITNIVSRHSMYLLSVKTAKYEYLYFFNGEEPFYLGDKRDGIGDDDVLSLFGYSSNDEFLKKVEGSKQTDTDIIHEPKAFCPACSVAQGELHHLGCPVEICPWCEGQLNYCNCRFEKLGVDEIVDEREIDRLEILLNDKGRIPFSGDQAPAYPTGGDDQGSI